MAIAFLFAAVAIAAGIYAATRPFSDIAPMFAGGGAVALVLAAVLWRSGSRRRAGATAAAV